MRLYILLSILSLSRAVRPGYLKSDYEYSGCTIGVEDHCVDELFTSYVHQADTDCDCIPDWCDVDPVNSNYGSLSQCQQVSPEPAPTPASVVGCTDATAFNYNADANTDDDSCVAVVTGCTDATAFNYNADANTDDDSCVAVVTGCMNATAFNYNADANTDDDSCVAVVTGCMNATAFNYNADANTEDDTIPCIYLRACTAVDEIFVSGACAQLSQYAISCGVAGGKSNLCSENDNYNGDTVSCDATLENKTNLKQTCASACCQATCADVSCPAKFNKKSPGTAGNTPEECCRETCGARHSYEDCNFEDYVYLGDSTECPSYECQADYCCNYVEPPSCDCHPAEATVLVQYACDTGLCVSPRRFDKLKVGDVVQTGENTFEPVLALAHQNHDASLVYDAFYTNASATPLYISDGHYLYANGGLVLAKNARVGDVLRFDAGSFAIERKERVQKDGIFHVTTWSGTLMVDGYKTSVYTNMADVRVQEYLTTPLFWSAYKLGLPTSFSNDCNKRVTRAIAYLSPMATFVVTYTPIWTWPVSFAAYLGLLAVLSYPVETTLAGLFVYKITKHKVKRI